MKTLALTQRVITVPPHGEKRDSLAWDWHPFLKALECPWLALPNEPEAALGMARRFDVGGLILTGGEDLGQDPERDRTEAALLDWCRRGGRPVLGVCRGFQFIQHWLGGELAPVAPARHRGKRHLVEFADGSRREVNSYHNFAPQGPAGPLAPLARCPEDGVLEAAGAPGLLGLSWHPEREAAPLAADVELIKHFFRELYI
jgi:putative glutamine amidotransferase